MAQREEFTLEVIDGAFSAASWMRAYRDTLVASAISSGALEWRWHELSWGVVFDVAFPTDAAWDAFRILPSVRAALDSVPNGLVAKRGWGGTSGTWEPRRPSPLSGTGAAELSLPPEQPDPTAVVGSKTF